MPRSVKNSQNKIDSTLSTTMDEKEKPTSSSSISGQFMTSSINNNDTKNNLCPSPLSATNQPLIVDPLPLLTDHHPTDNEKRLGQMEKFLPINSLMRSIHKVYRSNLTSPKWKNFQGSKIGVQDKIRLNNAIWRIWHQQYTHKMKTVFCRFISPLIAQSTVTPMNSQLKDQTLKHITDEYIKWRQSSKSTLKVFKTELATKTEELYTNRNPAIHYRSSTPTPDSYMIFDDLTSDLFQDQLLFTTTISPALDERALELAVNPDFYQPRMNNWQFDFGSVENSLYQSFPNEPYPIQYEQETMPNYSMQTDFTFNQPVLTETNPQKLSTPPRIITDDGYDGLQIYNSGTYSTDPTSSVSQQAYAVMPQSEETANYRSKSQTSTLAQLLHSKRSTPTPESAPPAKAPRRRKQLVKPASIQPKPQVQFQTDFSVQKLEPSIQMPNQTSTMNHVEMPMDSSPSSCSSCGPNAESKRRQNIKNGFDTLQSMIPELNRPGNSKISKAQMLESTALHIAELMKDRDQMKTELHRLENEKFQIQKRISDYHLRLPNDGIPTLSSARRSREVTDQLFRRYVIERTRTNWHFYPFSLILKPSFDQFQSHVASGSSDEFIRSLNEWKKKYLDMSHLRQTAIQAVMNIGTKTSFMTNPERVPDECFRLAHQSDT